MRQASPILGNEPQGRKPGGSPSQEGHHAVHLMKEDEVKFHTGEDQSW